MHSREKISRGLVVLKVGSSRPYDEIILELIQMVREHIGPVASFKTAVVVNRLPKTRSGKIMRTTISKIASGLDYGTPSTIDDPAVLDEIIEQLPASGYPRK